MIFCDCWLTELGVLLVTALALWYINFKIRIATFWSKRGIPHVKPNFIIGNAAKMGTVQPIADFFTEFYNKHKAHKVMGFWAFHAPVLAVFDREIVKKIMVKDFSHFHDRMTYDFGDHDPLISKNLFQMHGTAWRNMRVKLTPTFTSGKMKMMYPTMVQTAEVLKEFLKDSAKKGEVLEFRDVNGRFTTNMIASCAFGIEIDALKTPNVDFRTHGKRIFDPTAKQIALNLFALIFPRLGKLFKITQLPKETTTFFIDVVKETMEYRKLNNIQRKDFMQLLIELHEKGRIEDVDKDADDETAEVKDTSDTKFTVNEAAAQAFLFFAAGFETSSTTMTFALYELARNFDTQLLLKEEIKEALEKDSGSITYETIQKMEYLDCVVQETLRYYPTVTVLMREVSKDYYLSEFDATIPKKTMMFIPTLAVTHDPEYFENPDKFDPSRFSTERKHEIPPYTHIPFGEGPRNCIGNRFGLLQTKVGLVALLSNYTILPCDETPRKIKFGVKTLTLNIDGGMSLKIVLDEDRK